MKINQQIKEFTECYLTDLQYIVPEVLCGSKYTKAADIYSFGIIMNELISEEIPYKDTSHDFLLAVKICKGLRPEISNDTPVLLSDLITKCLNAKPEDRPTATELCQILNKWKDDMTDKNSEIHSQMKIYGKTRELKFKKKGRSKTSSTKIHSQAIYTSRFLNFKCLPKPENSSDILSRSGNLLIFFF